jgi:hypothetical protein
MLACLALALGLGVPGGEATAQNRDLPLTSAPPAQRALACYQWDIFPNERYKLDIRFHSPLSEKAEEERFGRPPQAAFSVHGKHVGVCGKEAQPDPFGATSTVRPVVGTLISVLPLGKLGGARLGLEAFDTTGVVGSPIPINWCKDVEIN